MKIIIYFSIMFSLMACINGNEEFVDKYGKFDFSDFRGKMFGHRGGIIYSDTFPALSLFSIVLDSCHKQIISVKEFGTETCVPDSLYNKELLECLVVQFEEMNIASLGVDSNLNIWVQVTYDDSNPRVAYFSNPDSISGEFFKILYNEYKWKPIKDGWMEQILSYPEKSYSY